MSGLYVGSRSFAPRGGGVGGGGGWGGGGGGGGERVTPIFGPRGRVWFLRFSVLK